MSEPKIATECRRRALDIRKEQQQRDLRDLADALAVLSRALVLTNKQECVDEAVDLRKAATAIVEMQNGEQNMEVRMEHGHGCSMGAAWMQHGCGMGAAWVRLGCSMGAVWMRHGRGMGAAWARHGRGMGERRHTFRL